VALEEALEERALADARRAGYDDGPPVGWSIGCCLGSVSASAVGGGELGRGEANLEPLWRRESCVGAVEDGRTGGGGYEAAPTVGAWGVEGGVYTMAVKQSYLDLSTSEAGRILTMRRIWAGGERAAQGQRIGLSQQTLN
jgi:hypothetical protein